MMRLSLFFSLSLLALSSTIFIGGCIGTDYLQDPVFEPNLEIYTTTSALRVGESLSFESVYYDASGKPTPAVVQWSSSNPSIASIDENGLLTGHQPGQVSVRGSVGDLVSPPLLITVVENDNAVANVMISPGTTSLSPGESFLLTAQATSIAGDIVVPTTLEWSSSNHLVATVDSEGRVHAVAEGRAEIIVVADGVSSNPAIVTVESEEKMRVGTFQKNPGTSYEVVGRAYLVTDASKGVQLIFAEDFSSSSGPRLNVYLSKTNRIEDGSLDLGPLQSTTGEQTYQLPAGVGINDFDVVLIHCVPFNVTFGFAEFA
ncbi:MAG: DM13 domain-containing protein, partial [Candidatus Kapaibacterium sp.]